MNPIIKWIGERFLHVVLYGAIILGAGFLLYSAFLKPTNSTKNVYTEPVQQYYDQSKFAPFSCARIIKDKKDGR
jgi:hypothetical protein